MKSWKKRALALTLTVLVLLSGCQLPFGGTGGDSAPVDTVDVSDAYFGLAWYRNGTLNPVMDGSSVNSMLREALYEGLFEIKNDFTAENQLCSEYTSDGTTFTFTLLDGAKFWSGAVLTADDVVESLATVLENEKSPYHNRLTEVSSIEAVDSRRVRIVLSTPNVNFPRLLDIPIYRAGTAEEGEFAEGTGPYMPVQSGGNTWTLEANTNWHGGFLGTIRHITLVKMTRAEAAESSFRTGDVSLVRSVRIAPDDKNITFSGAVDTVQTASAVLHYIGINFNNGQLANAKVRQALSQAISRESLCDTQLQSYADPAVLPVNPQPQDDSLTYSMAADLMTAAQYLREAVQNSDAVPADSGAEDASEETEESEESGDASSEDSEPSEEDGYYDEDGDFIYYQRAEHTAGAPELLTANVSAGTDTAVSDGKVVLLDTKTSDTSAAVSSTAKINLSFRLLVNSDNAFKVAAAQQIAASWNALDGVTVTVDAEPYDTYLSMLQSGSFDAYYGETQLTPDFDLRPLLAAKGKLNYGSCDSEEMTAAIAAYRSGEDTVGLYTTFLEQMPIIPLAFEREQVVIRKNLINNFDPTPYNVFAEQEKWVKP